MDFQQATLGRSFVLAFADGDDFLAELRRFCEQQQLLQGYIPMFLGGFRVVRLVGSCGPLADPEAPVWEETVLQHVEAVGAGTLARHPDGGFDPHIHLSVGVKADRARGHTSHLLGAQVQFIQEMVVTEILAPVMNRPRLGPHGIPTLEISSAPLP
ncbi:PPC domain-containing DNA-binding protein [Kitasatospora sp. MBT63]|uniref:PPC domain-containing DNA-binding protein n=1 Tax=Kitasatospora sp. MBT63 TaxID=1444768 RepID=UPI00053A559B|nr:PPC domain-containing DNA-binding protein [Kitasatospora sp. MBT63]